MHTLNESAEDTNALKMALLAQGVAERCAKCGIENTWEGSPLNLQVAYVDTASKDSTLNNIHLLCPNCHSQLQDHTTALPAKRTTKRAAARLSLCQQCQKPITLGKNYCTVHAATHRWQINYPEVNTLVMQVLQHGFVKTAGTIGVTDQGLRKHMQKELGTNHPIFTVRTKKLITMK